ncbi:MAG TPA: CAP domain-containing protein [Planctomycetota bacterium]|nr:CAP domain-containing protein [Planctomycetota bacterium]
MTSTPRLHLLFCLFALALGLRPAAAQDAFAQEEQDLVKQCVRTLSTFASGAKTRKVGQRAKQAYDLIIGYQPDDAQARSALDFEKKNGEWILKPEEKRTRWVDKATYENRFRTMDDWYKVCMRLSELHKKLGLKLKAAGNLVRATYHLQKAVYYNALDEEANVALGLEKGPGFYGTPNQIAFAQKMKEIETTAIEIARKDYPVEELPLEQMPKELVALSDAVPEWMRKPNFDIHGAKSAHFTVWTRGSQENASNAVKWGERALDFGIAVIGEKKAKQIQFVENATRPFSFHVFLWTRKEREEFLKANPHVWKGAKDIDEAMRFVNNDWHTEKGIAMLETKLAPVQVHDSMIGTTFKYGLGTGGNAGMSEGIVHAVCWYLQSTSITRFGALPEGTQGSRELNLPETTNWWLRAIRDQATAHTDWAADQVPREQLSRFRNDCRLKTWSFTTFLMAACPDRWIDYYLALPSEKIPTLEEVNAIAEKALGRKLADLEDEWREWARGDSGVAAGTGYGPPLLPERPSKEELAVLDRLNAVRGSQIAFTWPSPKEGENLPFPEVCKGGAFQGLPPCELDAETSAACEAHSKYLTHHTDTHMKWPEAHEEAPADPDFTPRGQRAGMSSVIVFVNALGGMDFARDSVDGWIGTPYHRFPLLEHNIKRFGYSFVYENGWTVATLDMGSLEEPYDPNEAPKLICFPANDMEGVPRAFHGREFPNPLEDQPEDQQDITKTGFPISVQFQRELAGQIAKCEIKLFECKTHGRMPTQNLCIASPTVSKELQVWLDRCGGNSAKEVPIWVHTPTVPLNKRVEIRDTVFALPKEHLEANKRYQARVRFTYQNVDLAFVWEFTTGSQKEGLKIK